MGRSRGMEFCCCYLPLVNVGAYLLALETALVALAVAVCALAPPSIVATDGAIPTWSKGLIAAFGVITLVWQVVGLISIARQMPSLYHTYVRINLVLTLIVIVLTAAFLVTSAAKRDSVVNNCVAKYGVTPSSTATSSISVSGVTGTAFSEAGHDICNIFVWVQTGVMAGLIVLMALTQLYMLFAQRAYGQEQRQAFRSSKSYQDIPMNPRDSGVWEPRANDPYGYRHEDSSAAYSPTYDSYGEPGGDAAHSQQRYSKY